MGAMHLSVSPSAEGAGPKTNRNKNKMQLRVLYALLGISCALIVAFAAGLALEIYTNRQGQSFYESAPPVAYKPRPAVTAPATGGGTPSSAEDEYTSFIDFETVCQHYPDTVAWLQSAGTVINYPVMKGSDNEYYLGHLPDKTSNRIGSIFLDFRNQADFSEQNIFIYGHNMASGDMFGSLANYVNQSYYEQNFSMYLFTPTADYSIHLFAGYIVDSAYEVPPMSFRDQSDFEQYISELNSRSVFKSDVPVSYDDRLVFLCTCTPSSLMASSSGRFVLVGKLVLE